MFTNTITLHVVGNDGPGYPPIFPPPKHGNDGPGYPPIFPPPKHG